MIVEVPGVGNIEFPDDTPPQVIEQALQSRFKPGNQSGLPNPYVIDTQRPDPVPPPGMTIDPQTGQMVDLRSPVNDHRIPTGAANAFGVGAGQGVGFGGLDEAVGGLNAIVPGAGTMGQRYQYGADVMREAERRAAQDHTGAYAAGMGSGIVADMALPGAMMGTLGKDAPLLAKVGASTAAGTGMGATSGFLGGEGGLANRAHSARNGALLGMGVGIAAPLVGAGVQKVADSLAARRGLRAIAKGAKSTAETRAASRAGYNAFENSGAEITPDAFNRLRSNLEGRLPQEGLVTLPGAEARTAGGHQILNTAKNMSDDLAKAQAAGQNPLVPLKTIDDLRQVAGDVGQSVNQIGRPTKDSRLGNIAVDEIDKFIDGLTPADVPIGDHAAAVAALRKARDLWAKASKTQLLDNVLEQQDNYLGGAASAIRNRVATLLRNPKTAAKFSDAEKKVLRGVIGGNMVSRAVRLAGNGIGRQMQMAGGGMVSGIPGAIAGALTGEIASRISDRNAIKAAEIARAIMANGGIKNLPVASDASRKIIETIMRRSGAVASQ